MTSVLRTPTASAMDPTTKTRPVITVAKVAAHHPAALSSMPKSPVSQSGSVGRNEKIPSHSKKVAR